MSIQQLASGGSNSIMSFLFHDDGSGTDGGVVLEGADFSSALHLLLGEYDTAGTPTLADSAEDAGNSATPDASLSAALAAAASPQTAAAPQPATGNSALHPLSAELDALATDFELPLHHAALAEDASWQLDAEGLDMDEAFWRLPADALPSSAAAVSLDPRPVLTGAVQSASNESADSKPVPPAFSNGINHLIELVREASRFPQTAPQAAAPLAPQAAASILPQDAGKVQPPGGKALPQQVRMPGKLQADPLQLQSALLPEAGQVPAASPQGALSTRDLAPASLHSEGRTQLQGGRKATQNLRSTFSGNQPRLADTETRAATSHQTMGFALNVQALLPEALPFDAQATTAANTAGNLQAQSMHAQHHGASAHAIAPKVAAFDNAGTTFANPQLYSPHPMGSDAWVQDLGTRVEWLQDMKVSSAELQLHPAELGALEIRIETGNDTTTVSFVTDNAAAREIIEDTLPKLREMLANQGMQLGQSQVSQQSAESHKRGHEAGSGQGPAQRDNSSTEEPAPLRRHAYMADPGRIDHYV